MTSADKIGIGLAVGFTVAFVVFSLSFMGMKTTEHAQTVMPPATPTQAPAPAPTPAPIPVPPTPAPVTTPAPEPAVNNTTTTPAEPSNETATTPAEETPETTQENSEMVMSADVSIPKGSSSPGCETDSKCFDPAETTVSTGATVTWTNNDSASHTVTSGTPTNGPDGTFDSSIITSGKTFDHTFDEAGEFDYFCQVHPWMTGKVTVE